LCSLVYLFVLCVFVCPERISDERVRIQMTKQSEGMTLIMEVSKPNYCSVKRSKAKNYCSTISQLVTVYILIVKVKKRRFPHFLDNQLTDGGDVVNLTHRPPFTSRKIPGTHFWQRLRRPQGHSAAGRIRSVEKSNDLIVNRNRDLPACRIVPQPSTLPRAPIMTKCFCVTNNHVHIHKDCIPLCSYQCGPTNYSVRAGIAHTV
jgi:hypothetical protein